MATGDYGHLMSFSFYLRKLKLKNILSLEGNDFIRSLPNVNGHSSI